MSSEGIGGGVGTVRGWFAVVLVLATVAAALPAPGVAAGDPTVAAENASVDRGELTTVGVSLSTAPDGVAGFNVTLRVADGAAATITDAELADGVGFGEAEVVEGGNAVRFKAADVNRTVEPGASDVALGSVTLRGDRDGGTDLVVSVDRLDDDDGSRVRPATTPGRLDVTDGSDADDRGGATDGNEPGDADGPVDLAAEPDTTDEAAVDGSSAEFDDTERLDRVRFEAEVDGTVEVAEYDGVSDDVEASIASSLTADAGDAPAGTESGDGGSEDDDADGDGAGPTVVSVVDVSPSSDAAADANATLQFTVDADDLDDPRNAVVVHGTEDGWERLETTVRDTRGEAVTLSARTDGFSLFAVVENGSSEGRQDEGDDRDPTTTPTAGSTTKAPPTTQEPTGEPTRESTTTATATESPGNADGGGLPGFTAGAAVVALAVLLVARRRVN